MAFSILASNTLNVYVSTDLQDKYKMYRITAFASVSRLVYTWEKKGKEITDFCSIFSMSRRVFFVYISLNSSSDLEMQSQSRKFCMYTVLTEGHKSRTNLSNYTLF